MNDPIIPDPEWDSLPVDDDFDFDDDFDDDDFDEDFDLE